MTDSADIAAARDASANSKGDAASPDHFAGRRFMLRALSEELVGPSPNGPEIDLEAIAKGSFPSDFKADGPYVQKGSKEEILCVEPPGLRYGVGILYPWGTMQKAEGADDSAADPDVETTQIVLAPKESKPAQEPLTRKGEASLNRLTDRARSRAEREEGDEFNLSGANKRRPTSMAVSFLARLPAGTQMVVRASGGRYEPIEFATKDGWRPTWWVRRKVSVEARFEAAEVLKHGEGALQADSVEAEGTGPLDIRVEAYSRQSVRYDERLITVCLINRTKEGLGNNGRSLFQASFDVAFEREDARECILPYPRAELTSPDAEEQTLDLLYRDFETYAVGHGCASDWSKDEGSIAASRVFAIALPSFETPSITPDIRRTDGTKLEVAMAPLAGLLPDDDGRQALAELVELYGRWIEEKASEAMTLDGRYKVAAQSHIELCRRCLERMRDGIALLDDDPLAANAFRLANEAILSQQLRASRTARSVKIENGNVIFDSSPADIDLVAGAKGRGTWRPFQIAFLLMSLRSSIEGDDADRETTDLIWFPTGGGKTEAYFGLAAFSAFHRRLVDPGDAGVHILMRYTLRLLTAQQFQRASGLVCAMEHIRARERESLGTDPFSIGIWLGGETTPNTRQDAPQRAKAATKGRSIRCKQAAADEVSVVLSPDWSARFQ